MNNHEIRFVIENCPVRERTKSLFSSGRKKFLVIIINNNPSIKVTFDLKNFWASSEITSAQAI